MRNSDESARMGTKNAQRRWMVMILMALTIIVIEAVDHYRPGYPLYRDTELLREILMFGVLLPISGGILLTVLEKTSTERDQVRLEVDQHYAFDQQLVKITCWDDLVETIVNFPETMLPVESTALHVYDPSKIKFELAAERSVSGGASTEVSSGMTQMMCTPCITNERISHLPVFMPCPVSNDLFPSSDLARYCIPLIQANHIAALLHVDLPMDWTLSNHDLRTMASVAPKMALAIENVHLQRSVTAQTEAAASERRRIAKDLHDTLGQNISFLRLKLDQFSDQGTLQDIVSIRDDLNRMREVASQAYDQIRATLIDLEPVEDFDLESVLRRQAQELATRTDINLHFDVDGTSTRLPGRVRRQLAYICREALHNIEKHARAGNAFIKLNWDKDYLDLEIADDGSGLNVERASDEEHFGLSIMQERAEQIQAHLSISSKKDSGTKVHLWLPLSTKPD
jgi:signal transduction histidine kinase